MPKGDVPFTFAELAAFIDATFGIVPVFKHRIATGSGYVFKTRTSRGDVAIKVINNDRDGDAQLNAIRRLEAAAFEAGIPMAAPVLTKTGKLFARTQLNDEPYVVRVSEWLNGKHAESTRTTFLGAATILGTLRLVAQPTRKPMDDYHDELFLDELRRNLGPDTEHRQMLEKIYRFAKHQRTKVSLRRFSHADVHNNLINVNGQIFLIDWDYAEPVNIDREALDVAERKAPHYANARLFGQFFSNYFRASGERHDFGPVIAGYDAEQVIYRLRHDPTGSAALELLARKAANPFDICHPAATPIQEGLEMAMERDLGLA